MIKKFVVISAVHFPLTMARYFWDAFEARDDVDLWVMGAFTNDWIPWNHGMHIDARYVKTPNFPIGGAMTSVPAALADSQCPKEADLWINIDAGFCIKGRPNKAKQYVYVQTDPHVLKDRYKQFSSQHDKVFCMQTPYMEPGEIWLPYGYSTKYHYPETVTGQGKEYDVCMIGLNYQHRSNLSIRLKSMGLNVRTGIGIVYNEYRQEYNKSRVALSWSSLKDTPARVFEAMAMGVPLVANRTPDLMSMFVENEHFKGFDSQEEAIAQIQWVLANPEEANEMQIRAKEAVAPHSWDARAEQIMEECGLL